MKKGSSNVFSSEQNGLAKLVLEVQNRQTSLESADDSIIKQEENEDTPKVHVIIFCCRIFIVHVSEGKKGRGPGRI